VLISELYDLCNMRVLGVSQRCKWGLRSSGMWRWVVRWLLT